MSSVTTPASVVPSSSQDVPSRSIPSLDELRAWTSAPDHRVVIQGVDWAFYEQLVDSIPEGANIHVDYDGKHVEIMALSASTMGRRSCSANWWKRSRRNWRFLIGARVGRHGNGRRSGAAWSPTNATSSEPTN